MSSAGASTAVPLIRIRAEGMERMLLRYVVAKTQQVVKSGCRPPPFWRTVSDVPSSKRKPARNAGQLQAEIMELMWKRGEASVRDIHAALSRTRPIAYT